MNNTTEAHTRSCWGVAIQDTEVNYQGTEYDTREHILAGALDAKISGLSTCICEEGFEKTDLEAVASYWI